MTAYKAQKELSPTSPGRHTQADYIPAYWFQTTVSGVITARPRGYSRLAHIPHCVYVQPLVDLHNVHNPSHTILLMSVRTTRLGHQSRAKITKTVGPFSAHNI